MATSRKRNITRLSETSDDESESGENNYPDQVNHFAGKRFRSDYSTTSSFSGTGDDEPDHETTDDGEVNADADSNYTASSQEPSSSNKSVAQKMLERMGYTKGKGLGKHQQGIVNPVEAFKIKGRRGLGHDESEVEATASEFDATIEVVNIEEEVSWFNNRYIDTVDEVQLKKWLTLGVKKETIDDEINFCDPEILREVLKSKSIFDKIGAEEMRKARTRSNPFELIRGVIFLNRAAMKMANMDRVFDFMFTKPRNMEGEEIIGDKDLLYFADVCAGPGGFSEYVLYRKKWRAKGFGFTLKNENDFRLSEFHAAPCETFEPHYGVKEDGNVFNPENIRSFQEHVLKNTEGKGVHFMMADGGFSVEGKENIQEIVSKQLYLCQCLVALLIVRTDGHFVVKLFDLFTPFSVGLIYLMMRSFHQISIHKPNTSRPANSERYLICKYKREDCCDITNHLFKVNEILWAMGEFGEEDVTHLVPLEILKSDTEFVDYITLSNNILGKRQLTGLRKIAAYCSDADLMETRQQEVRKKCLEYWDIPDQARTAPPKSNARQRVETLFKESNVDDLLKKPAKELTRENLATNFFSIFDWHYVVLGSDKTSCSYYLGLGRHNVYRYEQNTWKIVQDTTLELTPNTLIYGEIVQERIGAGRSQIKSNYLHVIDGLFLGGEDIRHLHITERWKVCSLFVKSLQKDTNPIRMKELNDLENLNDLFHSLEVRQEKSGRPCLGIPVSRDYFFKPSGVLFFKGTKSPWVRHNSRSTNYKYFYNPNTKKSEYENVNRPPSSIADFATSFSERLVWWWDEDVIVHESQKGRSDESKLQGVVIDQFVSSRKSKA